MRRALLVVASVISAGCHWPSTEAKQSSVEPAANSADTDWQRMKDCGAQAEHEFLAAGHKRSGDFAGFTSHYSPTIQRCFVLIGSATYLAKGTLATSRILFDGFEGKIYGEYNAFAEGSSTQVPECHVLSASGEKVVCKSDEEFTELVKPYMGTEPGKLAGKVK